MIDSALPPLAPASNYNSVGSLDIDIESAAFLETVLDASSDCIKVLSMDGELLFMNRRGFAVMEVDDFEAVRGCAWTTFWEGEEQHAAIDAIAAAKAGGTGRFVGQAKTLRGAPRWWDVTVTPIFGLGGAVATHLLSISRDITVVKVAQLQRELLTEELNHRVKNLLAVVGAIASQTFAKVDRVRVDAFMARLMALGEAQGLLVQTAWRTAPITEVVKKALMPHAPDGRTNISGPDLTLTAREALALALALHELATNAVKYGALSNSTGTVDIDWVVDGSQLIFRWTESGGPVVTEPVRTGFGSRIIKRNLAGEFKGIVDVNYDPSGVALTLTASR